MGIPRVEDVADIVRLYAEFCGRHQPKDARTAITAIRDSIRHETSCAEKGEIRVSRDVLRELRSDRARIGRIAKRYNV